MSEQAKYPATKNQPHISKILHWVIFLFIELLSALTYFFVVTTQSTWHKEKLLMTTRHYCVKKSYTIFFCQTNFVVIKCTCSSVGISSRRKIIWKLMAIKKNSWNYAHEEFSRDKYVAYSHRSDFDKYIPLIYVRNILKYDQVNVVIFKFV